MDYYELIIQWFNRASTETELFTKYIFLYIAFTAFLTQTRESLTDRDRINVLKNSPEAKDYYLKLISTNSELKNRLTALVSELKINPIKNISRPNDRNWKLQDGKLENENDWENLVEFWYRVRNNLFHGHKAPEFERDRMLVEFAFLTLYPLMKNFVDHYLAWDFS